MEYFQLNIRSMDDYVDERLQNVIYFENLLKTKEGEQNDRNREIVNAHAKWREEEEGNLEYVFYLCTLIVVLVASTPYL